jgi:prepilin peptidase CpaA
MIAHPFFPDPAFAWTYYLVLVGLTVQAAYIDLRSLTIPKPLTLAALALGVVFNLARGAWMGAAGTESGVWILGAHGSLVGALDGLLFALTGFVVSFALFFVMWFLGTCGGGDVKLFAALGAWVGPTLAVVLLAGTLVLVVVLSIGRLVWTFFQRGLRPAVQDYSQRHAARGGKRAGRQGMPDAPRTRRRLMAYSLPVALSTALVLLWVFRVELQLPVQAAAGANPAAHGARP